MKEYSPDRRCHVYVRLSVMKVAIFLLHVRNVAKEGSMATEFRHCGKMILQGKVPTDVSKNLCKIVKTQYLNK